MNKGKKLLDIKPGETFQRGNFEFIVFEHRKNGTACLHKDFCKYMRFDEKTGNYAHSQIRKYLNTEFYKMLAAAEDVLSKIESAEYDMKLSEFIELLNKLDFNSKISINGIVL